jgi:hypothetical protein
MSYGAFRFAHEFVRATPRVSHGFTGYQFAALAVFLLGVRVFPAPRCLLKDEPASTRGGGRIRGDLAGIGYGPGGGGLASMITRPD